MTTRFMLFADSSTSVDLYPADWNYQREDKRLMNTHRARSGAEYRYLWSSYPRYQIDLQWVESADASQINSWWGADTDLMFTTDSGVTVTSVHITNNEYPLGEYVKPYDNLHQGTIELEGY